MQIFKHRVFHLWAVNEGLTNEALKRVVAEIEKGSYEASLGSGLYKKRVPLTGRGKSGGYRTLVAVKFGTQAFFVYGFAKSVQANISEKEMKAYRKLAKDLFSMDEEAIQWLIEQGKLFEVK